MKKSRMLYDKDTHSSLCLDSVGNTRIIATLFHLSDVRVQALVHPGKAFLPFASFVVSFPIRNAEPWCRG